MRTIRAIAPAQLSFNPPPRGATPSSFSRVHQPDANSRISCGCDCSPQILDPFQIVSIRPRGDEINNCLNKLIPSFQSAPCGCDLAVGCVPPPGRFQFTTLRVRRHHPSPASTARTFHPYPRVRRASVSATAAGGFNPRTSRVRQCTTSTK